MSNHPELRLLIRETILQEQSSTLLPPGISDDEIVELFSAIVEHVPEQPRVDKIESEYLPQVKDPRERELIELSIRCVREMKQVTPIENVSPSRIVLAALGFSRDSRKLDGEMRGTALWNWEVERLLTYFRYAIFAAENDLLEKQTLPNHKRSYRVSNALDSLDMRFEQVKPGMIREALETLRTLRFWEEDDLLSLPLDTRKKLMRLALGGKEGFEQASELARSVTYT